MLQNEEKNTPVFLTLYDLCLIFIFTLSCKDFSSILHMLIHLIPFPNIITSYFPKIALPKQEQKFLRQIYYSSELILFSDCLYEIEINIITWGTCSLLSNLAEISQKLWMFSEADSHAKSQMLKSFTTLPLKTKTPLKNPKPTKQTKPVLP